MPAKSSYRSTGLLLCCNFVLAIGLVACRAGTPPPSNQASPPAVLTEAPAVIATDTPPPSPTPAPQFVYLLLPPGNDPALASQAQALLSELAQQEGLNFDVKTELDAGEIHAGVRLVAILAPDPGIAALAQTFPETQFLGFGISDIEPSANISLVGAGGERPDQQGFLAGYLAAVVTPDWRVGVIAPAGSPAGKAASLGFTNGAIFYCGLCRPSYPPFLQYPLAVDLPAGAGQIEQQAIADVMISNAVKTVYVAPGAGDAVLLEYLAQAGVQIIGSTPPPPAAAGQWITTIGADWSEALRLVWPQLISGQGNQRLEPALGLVDRNTALFSPGRQALVEKMLNELLSGYIETGVDPLTGDPK